MGLGDKIENAAEKAGGKGKEAAGNATGDDSLKAEGHADQAKGRKGGRDQGETTRNEQSSYQVSTHRSHHSQAKLGACQETRGVAPREWPGPPPHASRA